MTEKNKLLHMLDQAIELVRKEPGYVAPFAFHLTHLEAMRAALTTPSASAQQAEPVAWWNGIRKFDPDRDSVPPSFSADEDTWHDIPLYSGFNPCNSAAPAPASPGALTDEQIQSMWNDACKDGPGRPGWSRHIRFARALLAASPADQVEDALACQTCNGQGEVNHSDEGGFTRDECPTCHGSCLRKDALPEQPPIDNRYVADGCEQFASPAALTDETRAILQSVLDHDKRICSGLISRKIQTPNDAEHQAAKADQKSWDAVANRIRALLAASPATPAPAALTDRQIIDLWAESGLSAFTPNWLVLFARKLLAASPATSAAPTPQQISDYLNGLDSIKRAVVEREARAASPADQVNPHQFDVMQSLENIQLPMEGYDPKQPGYERRKGWNDACRYAMDVFRANGIKPMSATPPAAENGTSRHVANASHERES